MKFAKDKRYLASFETTASQMPIFARLTPCVKIRGGVGQISKSIFREIKKSSTLPKHVLDFQYVAPFRN